MAMEGRRESGGDTDATIAPGGGEKKVEWPSYDYNEKGIDLQSPWWRTQTLKLLPRLGEMKAALLLYESPLPFMSVRSPNPSPVTGSHNVYRTSFALRR